MRAQTKAIRGMNGVILCLLGISIGALTVASAWPQRRKLDEKELELAQILEQERKVIAEKEDHQAALDAMRDDQEYLELHAVDRLNLYRPGTTVYRIERQR
ncbi:cell division protein FtsB [Haloferula luteola]|uniref:Cell division protein FtsB n=2 Tax=Haloferula luteola TaxID=595692 RepID=A0A840V3U0_9BACT|nr:cell division protein FtsB [Haloferula luteola]